MSSYYYLRERQKYERSYMYLQRCQFLKEGTSLFEISSRPIETWKLGMEIPSFDRSLKIKLIKKNIKEL